MYGLLNSILKALGMHSQNFIFSETGAVPSLAVMALWGAGNTVVIYLAGLQGVSRQLYEAAEIDGASELTIFWKIVFPLSTPVIATISLFTALKYWNDWVNASGILF